MLYNIIIPEPSIIFHYDYITLWLLLLLCHMKCDLYNTLCNSCDYNIILNLDLYKDKKIKEKKKVK